MINKTKRGFSVATGVYGILLALFQAYVSLYVFMLIIPMALAFAKADQSLIDMISGGGASLLVVSGAYVVLSIFMFLKPKRGANGEYNYRKGVVIALIVLAVIALAITTTLFVLSGNVRDGNNIGVNLLMFLPTVVYVALLATTLCIKGKSSEPSVATKIETEIAEKIENREN